MAELLGGSVFAEVALLLMLAAMAGLVGLLLRQPLIVSFIIVGLLAGPSALDLVHSTEQVELLAELGIAVLLFLVGIKLDVNLIRSLGAVSVMTGMGQVIFTSVIGFAIGLALGFSATESLYIAVALTFSSTIIIVKLLSDKREITALHGQVALGFLIVQDLVVVFAMIVLSALGVGAMDDSGFGAILTVFASGLAMVIFVAFFVRFVAEPLTERLARSPELLLCFAIGFAAFMAAAGDAAGFGKELGGLMAGVSLASTRFRDAIASRLGPLRDFLLVFFFIALGATLDLGQMGSHVVAALIFSIFVLVGNPLIVLAIMGWMGYRKRTGFLAGLTVAQISEFSLIFIAMGVSLGHLGNDVLGLVTLVGLVTIALSTYMITYSHQLYGLLAPLLQPFERKDPRRESGGGPGSEKGHEVILFGIGRYGTAIAARLIRQGIGVLGIDFNPDAVRRWRRLGFDVEYGDATDPAFIAEMQLGDARWIVSTIPQIERGVSYEDGRIAMAHALREAKYEGRIAVTSHGIEDIKRLEAAGVDLVLEPFQDAADRAVELFLRDVLPERIELGAVEGETEPQ